MTATETIYGPTKHGRDVYVIDSSGTHPITLVLVDDGLHVQDYLMPEQARDLGNALLALALKHDPETVGAGVEQDNPTDWPDPTEES